MEITNKTLAMFLVAAIAVSLFGTIISLNKLSSISTTGYATSDTGTATVYVNSSTSIFFYVDAVNWGEGYVNATPGAPFNCTLNSEGLRSAGCVRFTQVSQGFVLENEGNTYPTINLDSDVNGSVMLGEHWSYGGPLLLWKVTANETNSCGGGGIPAPLASYIPANTTGAGSLICPALEFANGNDTLKIDVQVNIPYTVTTGQKTAQFTAQAS